MLMLLKFDPHEFENRFVYIYTFLSKCVNKSGKSFAETDAPVISKGLLSKHRNPLVGFHACPTKNTTGSYSKIKLILGIYMRN